MRGLTNLYSAQLLPIKASGTKTKHLRKLNTTNSTELQKVATQNPAGAHH